MNVFELLENRGFIYQSTDETAIRERLGKGNATFYIGFDPTADSLHVGHLLPLMAAWWLRKAGHNPIVLIGGGTALVGDPSGKTQMRQMLDAAAIGKNCDSLEKQIRGFFTSADARDQSSNNEGQTKVLNNHHWLSGLNYIEFLRDIGKCFSVNKMLTADSVKLRLETGLSFLEFNYMLLQAYDFYYLFKNNNCELQFGGQDQWGNIVAGIDLVRRIVGKPAFGATFPLLTDRQGNKFGKSVEGAVWLDGQKTSVFDYYQFWRNVDDTEVPRLLALYTILPMEEVTRLGNLKDPEINRAKEILAFEATLLAHGFEAAKQTYQAVARQFGSADPECRISTSSKIKSISVNNEVSDLPAFYLELGDVEKGVWIAKLLVLCGLEKSNGGARRLILGGGAYINDERITDVNLEISTKDFVDGQIILRSGKKNIRRIAIR